MNREKFVMLRQVCPVCFGFVPDHREETCSTKCQNLSERFHKRCAEAKLALQMMGFKCTWQNVCQLDIILPLGMAYLYPSVSQSMQWPDPRQDVADLGSEALTNYVDRMLGFNLLSDFAQKFYQAGVTYDQMVSYRDFQIKKHYHDDNFTTICRKCHTRRLHGGLSFHGDDRICLDCLSDGFAF